MNLKVMLGEGAYMPERAHAADAGYDLRTPVNVQIAARRGATIDTKVHVMIPKGYAGFIKSKSGLLSRNNIRVDGVVDAGYTGFIKSKSGLLSRNNIRVDGVVDAGYTGTIKVMMFNDGLMDKEFRVGDKIAQLVVVKISTTKPEQVDSFPDTERGSNGFGSSGR